MYPQYDPYDGSEELSYENEWLGEQEQTIEGADCFSPFVSLNPEENLIVLKLSEAEWTEMFSALYWGAMFAYPEKYLQIVANLLKGVHCPPILEDQECFDYPTYASFFRYTPMNPYIEPDVIPDGYETQPFLVNGENGNNIPNYQHYDVIVPTAAITLDADWFDTIAGQLPTIEVVAQGEGKVFLKMLTLPGGGLAVITIDNPPNLLDIISGIVTGADNIIDLNQDLVSLPPETAQELIFECDLVGTGLHTIYIVFLPILDDSLIPVRFGGGFRGATLCDFVEQPSMGITALRFEDCNLEMQVEGSWQIVPGWADWLDCIPVSPGGGGSGALATKTYQWKHATNTVATSSNVYSQVFSIPHTFQYGNFLLIVEGLAVLAGTATHWLEVEFTLDGVSGLDTIPAAALANINREFGYSNRWANVETGVIKQIELQIRSRVNGQSVTFLNQNTIAITIIEFGNPEDLFVEDIRIVGRDLQKKIGGAWITVTDSLAAILNAIEATANNALAAANSAISVNNTQQTQINSAINVNNTQNTRLNALESFRADAELELAQLALTTSDLVDRVEVLDFGGAWAWFHDFTINSYYAGSTGTYSPGVGWQSVGGVIEITYTAQAIEENQLDSIQIAIVASNPTGTMRFQVQGSDWAHIDNAGSGALAYGWMRLQNFDTSYLMNIRIEATGVNFTLKTVRYLGRGLAVPFD